jgi:DNA-binding IclR family transcriptional regulator
VQALARASGETTGLTVYDPETATATLVTEARGTRPVEYSLDVGSRIPLSAGAAGEAILAHCPREVVQSQSLHPPPPLTGEHEPARGGPAGGPDTGWAQAEGERVPDAFGVAVPFFAGEAVAGSLTFTIPRLRADEVDVPALTTMLGDTARELTALLSV